MFPETKPIIRTFCSHCESTVVIFDFYKDKFDLAQKVVELHKYQNERCKQDYFEIKFDYNQSLNFIFKYTNPQITKNFVNIAEDSKLLKWLRRA
jgi:hypothetical protein